MAPADLTADVLYQLGALDGFARAAGDRVRYLKPHGALYNTAATDPGQAGAMVGALLAWDRPLPVLTLPGSRAGRAAAEAAGLPVVAEAFADRGYRAGRLAGAARRSAGAVLHRRRPRSPTGRCGWSPSGDAGRRRTAAGCRSGPDSLCVHGDTPGAVAIAAGCRDRADRRRHRAGPVPHDRVHRCCPTATGRCWSSWPTRPRCSRSGTACSRKPHPAVRAVVPAARTVLVEFDPARLDPTCRALDRAAPAPRPDRPPARPADAGASWRSATTGPTWTRSPQRRAVRGRGGRAAQRVPNTPCSSVDSPPASAT